MMPPKKTWKAVETRVAKKYGEKRQIGSGSLGRAERSRSDSTHETLYVETKYREWTAARTWYDDTRIKAKKEKKIPVLILVDKGRPGFLVVVEAKNLKAVADLYDPKPDIDSLGEIPSDGESVH
jgi:hypothetical protein